MVEYKDSILTTPKPISMKPKGSVYLMLIMFTIFFAFFPGCNNEKADTKPVVSDTDFVLQVGIDKYVVPNEAIEEPVLPATRGPGDVTVAVNYLNAVADCSGGVLKIVAAMKGQKLTTFSVWVNIVPVLITEIKGIIVSGKQLKNFVALYGSAQGLTIEERAAVATSFANRFSIPYPEAEKLTKLLLESAFINMAVAGQIDAMTKKK